MTDNDASARPWRRSFVAVLVFCLPSLVLVVGKAILRDYISITFQPEVNAFVRFIASQLTNLDLVMYLVGPFFLIVALTIGLWSVAFGRQSRQEKQWIGILLVAAFVATAFIYKTNHP